MSVCHPPPRHFPSITDFIPKVLEDGLNLHLHDEVKLVSGAKAIETALLLASKEGIFTGNSGGATVATALDVAKTAPKVQLTTLASAANLSISIQSIETINQLLGLR